MIESFRLEQVIKKQKKHLERDCGILRNTFVEPLKRFAYIVSGIRRCGKSTFLRQVLSDKKKINYLNFEDVVLSSFEMDDFSKLLEIYERVNGKCNVYFFDEIQNISGWEICVRSLLDDGKEVFITGSNASMLSKELGTRLTGRYTRTELYPFSFDEFCLARKLKKNDSAFLKYLVDGGMPEFILQKRVEILELLVQDIVYRDILERAKINDDRLVKEIVTYVLANSGKEISFSKIKNLFGVGSVSTISLVMNALEDAYFLFMVPKFDFSLKKQMRNTKKIYCIDNGFISHVSFQLSPNYGRLLENMVFIELKRRGEEVYYHSDQSSECDFVIKKGMKIVEAIQVCYELNNDNRGREFTGLVSALSKYELNEGIIVTNDQDDEIVFDGKKIKIISACNWF